MEKLFQRKRRNSVSFVLLSALLLLSACGNSDPVTYTSIKGAWKCRETSQQGQRTYLIDIFKSKSDETTYLISNFNNIGVDGIYDIKASFSATNISISPVPQSLSGSQVLKSGSGTVNVNFTLIELDYIIYNGVNDIPVHAAYSR
jgi:hypothetical protein